MKAYRASESERRLQLTKGAFSTKESLDSHTEQAERIFTLSSQASKLESEQEMFTSFGSTKKEGPNPLSRIDAKHNKVRKFARYGLSCLFLHFKRTHVWLHLGFRFSSISLSSSERSVVCGKNTRCSSSKFRSTLARRPSALNHAPLSLLC